MAAHEYSTAFLTGASAGIGEALARKLASVGIRVAIGARREPELRALADRIAADGGEALVVPIDVSKPEEVVAAIEATDDRFGGIDLVIANAGISRGRWSGKLTWSDCGPVIDVNVRGAVATLVGLLPRMIDRGRGHLVGVSSIAQYRALPRSAVYSASKAFLSTFLEGLRVDLRQAGVTVTDVRPGFVRTALTKKNRFPMPFLMEPDQAADAIWDAILAKKAVHAFPLAVVTAMQTVSGLPTAIYDRIAPKIIR